MSPGQQADPCLPWHLPAWRERSSRGCGAPSLPGGWLWGKGVKPAPGAARGPSGLGGAGLSPSAGFSGLSPVNKNHGRHSTRAAGLCWGTEVPCRSCDEVVLKTQQRQITAGAFLVLGLSLWSKSRREVCQRSQGPWGGSLGKEVTGDWSGRCSTVQTQALCGPGPVVSEEAPGTRVPTGLKRPGSVDPRERLPQHPAPCKGCLSPLTQVPSSLISCFLGYKVYSHKFTGPHSRHSQPLNTCACPGGLAR